MPKSMRSLLAACLQGEDWAVISEPLQSIHAIYDILFLVYILFTQLALLNVVTGIFVDNSLNSAMEDRQVIIQEEMMREGLYKKELLQIFAEADENQEGFVPVVKLEDYLQDVRVMAYLKTLDVSYNDPRELVECIDANADQKVTAEEFVTGCMAFKSRQVADVCKAIRLSMELSHSIRYTLLHIEQMVSDQIKSAHVTHKTCSWTADMQQTSIQNETDPQETLSKSCAATVPQGFPENVDSDMSVSSTSTEVLRIDI